MIETKRREVANFSQIAPDQFSRVAGATSEMLASVR